MERGFNLVFFKAVFFKEAFSTGGDELEDLFKGDGVGEFGRAFLEDFLEVEAVASIDEDFEEGKSLAAERIGIGG